MSHFAQKGWMWVLAVLPQLGGEWLFQAKEADWRGFGERGTITVRRMSRVQYGPGRKQGEQIMACMPWTPFMFKIIDHETECKLDLGSVGCPLWIDAPENLVVDAMKQWIPETITPANEAMAKQAAKIHDAAEEFTKGGRIVKP